MPSSAEESDLDVVRSPEHLGRTSALFALQIFISSVLLSCMVPVYGSIPTYENATALFVPWVATVGMICLCGPFLRLESYLLEMQIALNSLLLRMLHFPLSPFLGPKLGPLVTQSIAIVPVILSGSWALLSSFKASSAASGRLRLERLSKSRVDVLGSILAACLTLIVCYVVIPTCAQSITALLGLQAYGKGLVISRFGLLRFSSACYSEAQHLILQRNNRWHSIHRLTFILLALDLGQMFDRSPVGQEHGHFRKLDRVESTTGYISVLQSDRELLRVLRNDHSLLGGIWLPDGKQNILIPEPVYPVFCMLEAVRLIECSTCASTNQQSQETALVIGLGIGTAPSALSSHGIDSTVVELDPAVVTFARNYFDLPPSVNTTIMDAVRFVARSRLEDIKYDYIIHDVFTGGVEPVNLFTYEFLSNLRALLKPSGTIAINYAGNIQEQSTRLVLKTICTVFAGCRAYRDSENTEANGSEDVINMVVFAHANGGTWSFREPSEADFLESQIRRNALPPRMEIDVEKMIGETSDLKILRNSDIADLTKSQFESACNHWRIMRKVLPAAVWIYF